MAITQVYVDPAINANSGTGTIGDPYGDLQYALNTKVRDATNGDQFNIKAGTEEKLAAALSLATYGTPSYTAPLVFRGYTSIANDGGVGEITGNSAVSVFDGSGIHYVFWRDLELHHSGNGVPLIRSGNGGGLVNCIVHDALNYDIIMLGTGAIVAGCSFYNLGWRIVVGASAKCIGNKIVQTTANACLRLIGAGCVVLNNLIIANGNSSGIDDAGIGQDLVAFNILRASSAPASKIGISFSGTYNSVVINNIIAGWSGAGSIGMSTSNEWGMIGHNAFYNNTTNIVGDVSIDLGGNVSLSADPFVDAGGGNFALTDTAKALLRSAGWPESYLGAATDPHLTIGLVQYGEAAGGGGGPVIGSRIIRGLGAV